VTIFCSLCRGPKFVVTPLDSRLSDDNADVFDKSTAVVPNVHETCYISEGQYDAYFNVFFVFSVRMHRTTLLVRVSDARRPIVAR